MEYTIIAITDSGCEEACQLEIARWTKAKTTVHLNAVELRGTINDAITLGYHLLSARRVLIQVIPPLQEMRTIAAHKPEHMTELFPPELTFKAEADVLSLRLDEKPVHKQPITQELVEEVGDWMHSQGRNVNLRNPDIVVYAISTPERIYVGIDVVGRTLSKRDWRIMLSRRSIKATIAAATVLYTGAKPNDKILDPSADDGTICVEAALLLSGASPLAYARNLSFEKFPALAGTDWKKWKEEQGKRKPIERISAYAINLQEMKAIRTNSKLAGVEKDIHATKVAMEWVETKIDENGVDHIITSPIPSGKSIAEKKAQKLDDELFYQAEYVLKKGGIFTAITEKPEELLKPAEKYGFNLLWRRDVLMGKRKMTIIAFKNKKRKTDNMQV